MTHTQLHTTLCSVLQHCSTILSQYDEVIKLQVNLKVELTQSVWSQAYLPVSSEALELD